MDEQILEQESGVEQDSVAGDQSEPNVNESADTNPNESVTEDTDSTVQVKDTKDFSAALKARETQLRNQMEQEYGKFKEQASYMEKLAQLQGYQSTDEFLKAVQEYEQQQIEQEAARLGMDVEQFQQYVNPINEELRGTKQQLEQMQSQLFSYQIERAENALKTQYPDFEQHREKVFNIAQELGLSPDKLDYAYKLATYDTKPAQVEQETIKKLQQNADSSPGSLSMGQDEKFTFSSLSPAEKSAFIERVKRGEITSF